MTTPAPASPSPFSSPAAPRRVLPVLVLAQLAGTSPWFAVNAVMPDLQRQFGWDAAAVGTLTAALQLGFIAGTLLFALLAVADRWPARRVFLLSALAAAGCTLAAAASVPSFDALLVWRALTGFCLAGIYPVGMKIAAQWFPRGLGAALGWLVGALVVGSASPHLLRALGAGLPWASVLVTVSLLAAGAGLLLVLGIPQAPAPPRVAGQGAPGLRLSALAVLWRNRQLRASVAAYCGHMVELYTLWVLVPSILALRLAGATAVSAWSFAVVGAGAVGCVLGGQWAARSVGRASEATGLLPGATALPGLLPGATAIPVLLPGSARVGGVLLATSGVCCLLAPWALVAPLPLFLLWLLVWGVSAAGDSPQFSALTAANAPRDAVGSVLTLTNSLGFAISVISIELFVRLAHTLPLASVLPWLAVGPVLGLLGLRTLLRPP